MSAAAALLKVLPIWLPTIFHTAIRQMPNNAATRPYSTEVDPFLSMRNVRIMQSTSEQSMLQPRLTPGLSHTISSLV